VDAGVRPKNGRRAVQLPGPAARRGAAGGASPHKCRRCWGLHAAALLLQYAGSSTTDMATAEHAVPTSLNVLPDS